MKPAGKTAQDCEQVTSEQVTAAERITIALIPPAAAALARLQERTSLSKTDIVNRGISLYEFIETETGTGARVLIERTDGTTVEVRFL